MFMDSDQILNSPGRVLETAADFLDLVYPPVCGLCFEPANSPDHLVCQKCWEAIRGFPEPFCLECRHFIRNALSCPDCKGDTLIVFSLGVFDAGLKTIIHDLKFQCLKPLAVSLGIKLAEIINKYIAQPDFDLIIPVPLYRNTQNSRGFNQAAEIAAAVGSELGLIVNTDVLYQSRRTRQQARLGLKKRIKNVHQAFAIDDPDGILRGAKVLLIDDVTTTGATLRENARVLYESGAKKITAAVAATAV